MLRSLMAAIYKPQLSETARKSLLWSLDCTILFSRLMRNQCNMLKPGLKPE